MKCISLWQPWATLWVAGVKIHETRHWPTNYRGPLGVHAAKHKSAEIRAMCEWPEFLLALRELGYTGYDQLPFGAIVGGVDLVDCKLTEQVYPPEDIDLLLVSDALRDWQFGNFGSGRFAWRAERPMMLNEPIPYKGRQGFFDVPSLSELTRRAA